MVGILDNSGYDKERKLKIVGTSPMRHDGFEKVTGRSKFSIDMLLPGMLWGKVLRSPHAHAIIKSIDTSAAERLAGVKAVVTSKDFPELPPNTPMGEISRNFMARDKVFYDGHAVAAVAATSEQIARRALKLIKVEYEVLPHVIDPLDAMQPDAPVLHQHMRTKGAKDASDKPTNVAERLELVRGDIAAGFRDADVVIEREFKTRAIHQGYMEPQGCLANATADGNVEVWCGTQGPFVVRNQISGTLKIDAAKIRVTPCELGGGFGGRTTSIAETVAILLSRKTNRPVKIVLTRNEVFRCTGPAPAHRNRIKLGATRDGRITAAEAEMRIQAGPFTGSMFQNAPMGVFTRYDLPNVRTVGYEVVSNRPKVAAFRSPHIPQSAFAAESVIDEMAMTIGMDPVEFRLRNVMREGSTTVYGETFGPIGAEAVLEALKESEHYNSPLAPGAGRGVACGFYFNRGGETTAAVTIAPDGTVNVLVGLVDVAGSRLAMSMMVAEEFGIPLDRVRTVVADTTALGHNMQTTGSRSVFAGGMVVIDSTRKAIAELVRRAARKWNVAEEAVVFADGECRPAGANVGEFPPLTIAELAKQGAVAGHSELVVTGQGPGFGAQCVDLAVDKETGRITILRHSVFADAGKVIHRVQLEGQFQGALAQGTGWALNEEYIYGPDGCVQNPNFLDYRVPVASDLVSGEPHFVEVPNPKHPFGARGCGETPLTPTLAAIANAVTRVIGVRPYEVPLSPPRILKLIAQAQQAGR